MEKIIKKYKNYCNSLTQYSRYVTREVKVGNIPLGGKNPIRIQSMTTTDTMDTIATVEQTIRMFEAGCEYVRITAPSINEAQNLAEIKKELQYRGYNIPLIADIHFTPNAAEVAARIIEKVRVNPGNYADRKKFQQIDYTNDEYNFELERIRNKFVPLVKICKEYGTAMRIGTNHGSLSDRIMSRFGDTPDGMVEAALEFVRICQDENYFDIVLSMKASNPQVMVQAYRLLIQKMQVEKMNYPLHLGVTEAGDGEDGRIKSALGIGALLEDGIGDTIRVSLTEEPENESPVAIELANRYKNRVDHKSIIPIDYLPKDPTNYFRREAISISNLGGNSVPKVFADFSRNLFNVKLIEKIGYHYSDETDKWNMDEMAADFVYIGKNELKFETPQNLKIIYDYKLWMKLAEQEKCFPIFQFDEFIVASKKSFVMNFVYLNIENVFSEAFDKIANDKTIVFVVTTENIHGFAEQRRIFFELLIRNINNPVIIKRSYSYIEFDQLRLYASTDIGGLLIEGFGDGVWVEYNKNGYEAYVNKMLFGILQAARVRISKTEYIACPSCGRTLFNLVDVTNKIRNRTEHLKGIKIGIMGCIVNGPGEMADADYGYVGSGVGKITLYRGKEIVRKNIASENAVEELINIIKGDGNWVDK
ncbi:MAG: 4-hydroxy-3-methylbut-2-en-1-yl diphosphate synthase [Ignavibacteriales bacterium CG_4_9_14_3_um_filter_34_10]|nr:MAG: 4-hydroxy-3-methylbut-2-en-1-yl diphosphate synthase [Ignavibacteriales bacterium CG_4_9_14_3_um_filter_34_10]